MRRLKWVSGIVWMLSWFGLFLEIFLWHHVTKTLHLNPPPPPPGTDIQPQPGEFLIAVLVGSAVAPLVFLAAVAVDRARRRSIPAA
jgi:hypothetical protein